MKKEEKTKSERGFIKSLLIDIRETIIFEIVLRVLLFIPRLLIRFIKQLF